MCHESAGIERTHAKEMLRLVAKVRVFYLSPERAVSEELHAVAAQQPAWVHRAWWRASAFKRDALRAGWTSTMLLHMVTPPGLRAVHLKTHLPSGIQHPRSPPALDISTSEAAAAAAAAAYA